VHLLLLVRHLLSALGILLPLAEVAAQALFEILLLVSELFGFVGHVGHFGAVLLASHRLNRLLSLLEALSRLLGFRLPRTTLLAGLTGGCGGTHITGGLFDLADRLV
jgi:hypothetical protein